MQRRVPLAIALFLSVVLSAAIWSIGGFLPSEVEAACPSHGGQAPGDSNQDGSVGLSTAYPSTDQTPRTIPVAILDTRSICPCRLTLG